MAKQKYEVLRIHVGDREYLEGDVREGNAAELAHLVDNGILRPIGADEAKSAPAHANKMEPDPSNKEDEDADASSDADDDDEVVATAGTPKKKGK